MSTHAREATLGLVLSFAFELSGCASAPHVGTTTVEQFAKHPTTHYQIFRDPVMGREVTSKCSHHFITIPLMSERQDSVIVLEVLGGCSNLVGFLQRLPPEWHVVSLNFFNERHILDRRLFLWRTDAGGFAGRPKAEVDKGVGLPSTPWYFLDASGKEALSRKEVLMYELERDSHYLFVLLDENGQAALGALRGSYGPTKYTAQDSMWQK